MNKKVLTDDKLNRLLKSLRAVYASKEAEVLSVGFARYADRGTSPERVRRNGSKVEGKTVAYFGRLDALLEHLENADKAFQRLLSASSFSAKRAARSKKYGGAQ